MRTHCLGGIVSTMEYTPSVVGSLRCHPPKSIRWLWGLHGFGLASVITSKAANGYHFKTGQRDWPSRTENVLTCRLLRWQVGFGAPASRSAFEHVAVMQ